MRLQKFILLILIPITAMGQDKSEKTSCSPRVSKDEIYQIIREVIRYRNVDTTKSLNTETLKTISHSPADVYLKTLLKDSTRKFQEDVYNNKSDTLGLRFFTDKNLLEPDDLKYIMCTKKHFSNMEWRPSSLGFRNKSTTENFYSFSLPYINRKHDLAIVEYEYHCGSLCADGGTLVLKREGNRWVIGFLQMWES